MAENQNQNQNQTFVVEWKESASASSSSRPLRRWKEGGERCTVRFCTYNKIPRLYGKPSELKRLGLGDLVPHLNSQSFVSLGKCKNASDLENYIFERLDELTV